MKSTTNLVWHIFKKDAKLLWPFVLGVASIQFTSAGVLYAMDHLAVPGALFNLSRLLQIATILASAFLIATVVHQDAIPGVRQDWLVRPVRRRDLLLAKLLFVLLMVHGPILLADTMQALANGFPLTQSVAAAASRGLYLLIGLSVPLLAFASLTRNMAEAVIGAVLAFLGFAVLRLLLSNTGNQLAALQGTGLFWIAESAMFLMAFVGSSAVLAVQYFRRKTTPARWAMAAVALLFLFAYLVPWNVAFALEQRLSPNPSAGSAIAPVFEPSLGKFRLPEGMTHNWVIRSGGALLRDEASTVYLPLHIAGLPDGVVLNADHAQALLTGTDGSVVYRGPADDLLVRNEDRSEPVHFNIGSRRVGYFRDIGPQDGFLPKESVSNNGKVLAYQGVALPRKLYERIKDRSLRLEIDYSLTLLRGSTYTMPALGGDLQMPSVGRCKTQMDDDGDDVRVRCIQAGGTSNCASAFLEHVPSGRRNPATFSCWPDYSPYFGQYTPDAMVRFGAALRFRDVLGLAKYPVDAPQLPESRVVIHVYQAQDHFTQRLVIPEIRLSDWESLEQEPAAVSR